ncbi:MAG: NADH-quinone oxidoreductase subunit L [Anaerolineae bacterium]|nr:NADH-quinone oxidoreductase subunit L [Anaerolineae bacterium]
MEGLFNLAPLVILAPAVGLLINLFIGGRLRERSVGWIASIAAGTSFVFAAVLSFGLARSPAGGAVYVTDWVKLPLAGVDIAWDLRVDTLSVTMMLAVAGVGTLIHVYAIGYMHGDAGFRRFFVYLNLFLVAMLTLVSGNNYLVLFVGWELVGLCSFLLIGFWLHKPERDPETGEIAGYKNTAAAKKAFIVNRVGDFGFLLAILLIFWTFGTLTYGPPVAAHGEEDGAHGGAATLAAQEAEVASEDGLCVPHGEGVFEMAEAFMAAGCDVKLGSSRVPIGAMITLITLLMILGVTGKSAQIPLFVWLPDAMAGPTPVSALIHAATMVTAGVYMVTRSNVLYELARGVSVLPFGLTSPGVLTIIGALTAFMAGTVALAQWDIKRVLAFSTVSQLGFMVAAVGLGGYIAGMFHLVTHAFFKALLFLSAGSVIHGVEHGHHHAHDAPEGPEEKTFGYRHGVLDPQDMRNMGGLRQKMPATFWVYLIGALALAGIVPFAGFWSKDEILLDAYSRGDATGWFALILLMTAAAFTAFYMGRQVFMIFFGAPRTQAAAHAQESPPIMTRPLVVLAFFSAVAGFLNWPGTHSFGHWLQESVAYAHIADFNLALALLATLLALLAIFFAALLYYWRPALRADGADRLGGLGRLWRFLNRKWYWDEFYELIAVQPFNGIGRFLAGRLDGDFLHDWFHDTLIWRSFDRAAAFLGAFDLKIIDGAVNGLGWLAAQAARYLRRVQTGYVRQYALGVLVGAIVLLFILVLPLLIANSG